MNRVQIRDDTVLYFKVITLRKHLSILLLYAHLQHHNDTIIKTDAGRKTQKYFFNNILPLTLFVRFRNGCSRVACERELEIEHNWNILTPLLWPSRCVFLLLLMLGSTPSGFKWPLRPDVAFLTTSRLPPSDLYLNCPCGRRTQLEPELNSIIIVQCPLDLWNRMFNRHQAEITVMQFSGHSLPVHHFVVYHGNYLVPFHQPISTHAISSPNCH